MERLQLDELYKWVCSNIQQCNKGLQGQKKKKKQHHSCLYFFLLEFPNVSFSTPTGRENFPQQLKANTSAIKYEGRQALDERENYSPCTSKTRQRKVGQRWGEAGGCQSLQRCFLQPTTWGSGGGAKTLNIPVLSDIEVYLWTSFPRPLQSNTLTIQL